MSRLFHAIVVMGAGLSASGCGGQVGSGTAEEDASPDRASELPAPDASPDRAGEIPAPEVVAQWDCDNNGCETSVLEGGLVYTLNLTVPCGVDTSRPRTAADCATGQWFQCTLAFLHGTPLAINCTCAPPESACLYCAPPTSAPPNPPMSCGDHTKLCTCPAYTGILA